MKLIGFLRKSCIPYDLDFPFLGFYLREMKACIYVKIIINIYIHYSVVKNRKQHQCLSADKQMNKQIHTAEYDKKNEPLILGYMGISKELYQGTSSQNYEPYNSI